MTTFLGEISAYLVAKSLGTLGTDLFEGRLPDNPDVVTAVLESSVGEVSPGFGVVGVQHETAGLQILVRGAKHDYDGPRAKIESVYRALAEIQGAVLSGTQYLMALAQQSPFLLERDDEERAVFAVNFLCEKELSA